MQALLCGCDYGAGDGGVVGMDDGTGEGTPVGYQVYRTASGTGDDDWQRSSYCYFMMIRSCSTDCNDGPCHRHCGNTSQALS